MRDVTCDGRLFMDGLFVCDTAENTPWRVQPGQYRVILKYHSRLGCRVPTLARLGDRRPRHGNRSHRFYQPCFCIGNGVYGRKDGRILVGHYLAPGVVKWSRECYLAICQRVYAALRQSRDVRIVVKDVAP